MTFGSSRQERVFDGATLLRAITKTFQQRSTAIDVAPVALSASFATSTTSTTLWSAFRRGGGGIAAPPSFADVVTVIRGFVGPVVNWAADGERFEMSWKAAGPWLSR